ncbi:MAG: Holliday junction resolvase RecU [Lachnospiraceae bacterium]|nr:Holliday junction resolvase RecU [Lachnospiraceae bacterium]
MGTWKSRGLRGSTLEDMINHTNYIYKEKGLALIQKIPTPITPIDIDKESRHITLAYFDQKSTVDYIGAVQGIPICFDAKECATDTFPLQNVHEHQIDFMNCFEKQGGVSFLIIHFTHRNEMYYIPLKDLNKFWNRMINGGRKSFKFDEINKEMLISQQGEMFVHYLVPLQTDLDLRDE